jgi:hypothetical protein
MKTDKLFQLGALAILFAMLLITMFSCTPKSGLAYHQGLQKEATFENRMKSNTSFTIQSAKDTGKSGNQRLKDERQFEKDSTNLAEARIKNYKNN